MALRPWYLNSADPVCHATSTSNNPLPWCSSQSNLFAYDPTSRRHIETQLLLAMPHVYTHVNHHITQLKVSRHWPLSAARIKLPVANNILAAAANNLTVAENINKQGIPTRGHLLQQNYSRCSEYLLSQIGQHAKLKTYFTIHGFKPSRYGKIHTRYSEYSLFQPHRKFNPNFKFTVLYPSLLAAAKITRATVRASQYQGSTNPGLLAAARS